MWFVNLVVRLVRTMAAVVIRRLTTGPLRPTWTWPTELTVAAMREFLATLEDIPLPTLRRFERQSNRAPLLRPQRTVVTRTQTRLAGVDAEWLEPARPTDAALLYLHGGGYVSCSPGTHRHFTSALAWIARIRVVAIDYRLAPEHPFPAAIEDAAAAYGALIDSGVDPRKLFVAGDSAGGGLTLLLLLELKRRGLPQPAGAICLSPYTDLTWSGPSWSANTAYDYLPGIGSSERLRELLSSWFGGRDPADPRLSPLFADLSGLAPLLVIAGEAELLVDDSRRFVEAARRAGVDVTYVEAADMVHVYPIVLPLSRPAMVAAALMADFVADHTGGVATAATEGFEDLTA